MNLVDTSELVPALIYDGLVAEGGVSSLSEADVDDLIALPAPWLLDGESPLRAQMRLLSGRADVTAWTVDAGRKLAEVLGQPVVEHRTLLGLNDDSDDQPPAEVEDDSTR